MSNQITYEAVILNSYEHNGETKWRRTFIANLKPDQKQNSFSLYIPEGLSISGRVVIQEKQAKTDDQGAQQ